MPRPKPDRKAPALRQQGCLHAHPEKVSDELFTTSDFFDPRDLLQVKYEMLRRVSLEKIPVTAAAALFGFSRVAFYQIQKRFEEIGIGGLLPLRRGPKSGHKLTPEVMNYIEEALTRDPLLRSTDLVHLLEKHFSIEVHPRSIERAFIRHKKKFR